MAITPLRDELLELTKDLIHKINSRKDLVSQIQSLKENTQLKSFDPAREKLVFKELKESTKEMTLKELMLVSLLIEVHAGAHYPQWSESIHLAQKSGEIIEKINPVLLLQLRPDEFKLLQLKPEFEAIINE